jgi:anti-sigma regulatory factor (Ser/Thr protein kinase)
MAVHQFSQSPLRQPSLPYLVAVGLPETPGDGSAAAQTELRVAVDLPLSSHAAASARRTARDVLRAWAVPDEDRIHDVCLIVSELVTNAVRHGGTRVRLELALDSGNFTVAAADGSAVVPQSRSSTDDDENGRGLAIIEALADSWGVDEQAGGKRVWARLRR